MLLLKLTSVIQGVLLKSAFMFFRRYATAICKRLKTKKGPMIMLIFSDEVSIAKILVWLKKKSIHFILKI